MSLLPPPSARKRKREEELGPSVLIDAHAESPFDNPVRIIPTIVLPRAYFPLQWLSGVPARLYHCSNHIPALSEPGKIAVVKMEGERQLSVVESLEKDAYVLYKLSTQVRLKDVRKLYAQLSRLRMDGEPAERVEYKDAWWEDIGSMTYPFTEHPLMPRPMLESRTEKPTPLNQADQNMPETEVWDMAGDVVPDSAESPRQSSTEVLENLRNQYYETLYLTKTSLAYFSKSALSRARAYFQGDDPGTPSQIGELTAFLHSMFVPLSNMDSKHRKTLPTFVSEERIDDVSILKKNEETYLQNWRTSAFGDRVFAPTDPRVKCVLEKLKTRETELQVIILLEILSLEKLYPSISSAQQPPKPKKKEKKKKKHAHKNAPVPDPDTHLELLVDRLCIWHSIGPDPLLKQDESPKSETIPEKDYLRNFSMEVIMPFYASKLPEKCASINKKFGIRQVTSKRTPGARSRLSKPTYTSSSKKEPSAKIVVPKLSCSKSETSLSAVAAESQASKICRGGNLTNKNLSKRVIQFEKVEVKKVNEELEQAINALKKPNRRALAGEFVDSIEERLAKSKKPQKKPLQRSASTAAILVSATPRKPKLSHQDHLFPHPHHHSTFTTQNTLPHPIASTPRKRPYNTITSDAITSTPVLNRILNTPSIPSFPQITTPKRRRPSPSPSCSSPSFPAVAVVQRQQNVMETPLPNTKTDTGISIGAGAGIHRLEPSRSDPVFETPVKGVGRWAPEFGTHVGVVEGTPISVGRRRECGELVTNVVVTPVKKKGGKEKGRADKDEDGGVGDIFRAWDMGDDF